MYKIELAKKEEIKDLCEIIISRCNWLKENNIRQWIITSYPIRFDHTYFEQQMKKNKLLIAKKGKIVCGGLLLKEEDNSCWSDQETKNAYYIHHFVTKIGEKGLGKRMIEFSKQQAKEDGKEYLRLDCVSHNKKLNTYYYNLGFEYIQKEESKGRNLWQIKL